jgi:hypothetical protein
VIGSEILDDLNGRIGHVSDPDHGRGGLCVDEIPNIVEAVSYALRIACFVDENEQLQRSVLSAGRNQLLYRHTIPAQSDILRSEDRKLGVIANGLVRDDHMKIHCTGGSLLLRLCGVHAPYKRNEQSE